jgi:hypothetical protein
MNLSRIYTGSPALLPLFGVSQSGSASGSPTSNSPRFWLSTLVRLAPKCHDFLAVPTYLVLWRVLAYFYSRRPQHVLVQDRKGYLWFPGEAKRKHRREPGLVCLDVIPHFAFTNSTSEYHSQSALLITGFSAAVAPRQRVFYMAPLRLHKTSY